MSPLRTTRGGRLNREFYRYCVTDDDVGRFLDVLERAIRDFRRERPGHWQKDALRQRRLPLHRLMTQLE